MVKSLLVLINMGALMLLNIFLLQKIEVDHKLPEKLLPGESTEVEVVISKGKVSGFAKLQFNVDNGLVIENIESEGASFTFNEQKAKFIWMSLPEDKSVSVRYKLTALPQATGPQKVEGHFSYIDDNKRLVHDLPVKYVQTTGSAIIAEENNAPPNSAQTAVSVDRIIEPAQNGRYRVTLQIKKSELAGFAKVEETISPDYTASALETTDAVFNIIDKKVKFVWFDIPAESDLIVSYELIPVVENPGNDLVHSGEFSYLINNETQSVTVTDGSGAPSESEEVAEITDDEAGDTAQTPVVDAPEEEQARQDGTIVEAESEEGWKEEELIEETSPVEEQEVAAETIADEEEQTSTETVQKSAPEAAGTTPEEAITYRVQIAAAKKLVTEAYFETQHNYHDQFIVENHEGWVKYTTGRFTVYRDARDHRNEITREYNFPGPFVTAYNDGERITVQEALMIANQKWVP